MHLIDGPGSLSDRFYVGALELAMAAACVPVAVVLLTRPVALLWHATGALCTAALLAFLLSRTVGLPGATDDVGNRGQLLGVLHLTAEATVIAPAAVAVHNRHAAEKE